MVIDLSMRLPDWSLAAFRLAYEVPADGTVAQDAHWTISECLRNRKPGGKTS
jgi:hypothetical protein